MIPLDCPVIAETPIRRLAERADRPGGSQR